MKYFLSLKPEQHKKFIRFLQKRIANISIGASTARGIGKKGLIAHTRDFLEKFNLNELSKITTEEEFKEYLDTITENLAKKLQKYIRKDNKAWGPARKFLNIFFREVLYNKFLCEEYNLNHLEKFLEIPIDSHVALSLIQLCYDLENKKELPKWKGVIHLSKYENEKYQDFANDIAKKYNTFRVHLDLIFWRKTKSVN